jgi:hypothetical protein
VTGRRLLLPLVMAAAVPAAEAQLTTAERSGFTATSSHAEVLGFLDSLQVRGAGIRVGTLGFTPQGRPVPYVVASRPLVDDAAAAHRSGKPIVLIQANIHGGEVEGKEVAQMLLRDLTLGSLRPLLDSVVVLVVPNYNADGNDAFGPAERQRPGQNGPAVVGTRANSMGLNLNRDYTKQEAPETRGMAALVNAWDPDLFLDLHTTNGSYHGYVLTYATGLNPNTNPANEWMRDFFLPEIRTQVRQRHSQEMFWYGNFRNQDPDSLVQGWWTYDARPMFGINWIGMRGRMGILSEAYSNDPFEIRLRATYNFVLEILRLAARERATIKRLIAESSALRPDSVGLRSAFAPPRTMDVIAEITEAAGAGAGGFARRQRTGVFRTIAMPVYDRFEAVHKEAMPAAYLLPPEQSHLVEGLRRHGIVVQQLTAPWQGQVEGFRVDSVGVASQVFEGHRNITVRGAWGAREGAATPGWYLISTDQQFGVLAAYLLEPGSEDGFAFWGFLNRDLRRGAEAPILRARRMPAVATRLIP